MIKLVVTDVDGTLLDNNADISELNLKALLSCEEIGIGIVLATGKSIFSIRPIIQQFDLKLPQITLNGAVIVDKDLKVINSIKIPPGYYFELIKEIRENNYNPLVALTDGRIFFDRHHPDMKAFNRIKENITKIDSIETDFISKNCVSVSVAIKEEDPLDLHLRNKFSSKLQLVRSGEYFFDILNLDATKGNALHFLAEMLKIDKKEIAVFGDSYNDLSMFSQAGLRIATGNSYQKVLEAADFITDENYNSGFGKAVYKYILKV
jgi:Cof subfamily protein (haloacid dehalogenase superfamily)